MPLPVLIVGAGPTGLNLALSLARRGVPVRIISDADGPGHNSRAMVVQARTLEFYNQLGFAEETISQGVIIETAHILESGRDGHPREVAHLQFKSLGDGISPYPFALAFPQDDHERLLLSHLQSAGAAVEWHSELVSFTEDADTIRASILNNGNSEEVSARYICGCDGAHSAVRDTLKIGFPGGAYDQRFYVADVRLERSFDRDLYIALAPQVFTLMFPVRASGLQRLIGLVRPELSARDDLTFDDLRQPAERQLGVRRLLR